MDTVRHEKKYEEPGNTGTQEHTRAPGMKLLSNWGRPRRSSASYFSSSRVLSVWVFCNEFCSVCSSYAVHDPLRFRLQLVPCTSTVGIWHKRTLTSSLCTSIPGIRLVPFGYNNGPEVLLLIKFGNNSCEIRYFIKTHLSKLCVILRTRVLRVLFGLMPGIQSPIRRRQNLKLQNSRSALTLSPPTPNGYFTFGDSINNRIHPNVR